MAEQVSVFVLTPSQDISCARCGKRMKYGTRSPWWAAFSPWCHHRIVEWDRNSEWMERVSRDELSLPTVLESACERSGPTRQRLSRVNGERLRGERGFLRRRA